MVHHLHTFKAAMERPLDAEVAIYKLDRQVGEIPAGTIAGKRANMTAIIEQAAYQGEPQMPRSTGHEHRHEPGPLLSRFLKQPPSRPKGYMEAPAGTSMYRGYATSHPRLPAQARCNRPRRSHPYHWEA